MKTAAAVPLQGMSSRTGSKKRARLATQYWTLFKLRLLGIRDTWYWLFVMGAIFPMGTLLFLHFFMPDAPQDVKLRILTGNMVGAFILAGITMLANSLSWERHQGMLVYFKSLPLSKFVFILAVLSENVLLSLPSVLTVFLIGGWYMDVELQFHLVLLPVLLLAAYSVAGIGVLIGMFSPNHQLTNLMTNFAYLGISFLSPIMIRMDQLPWVLQKLAYLMPTTYVAEAFRGILSGGWSTPVAQNVGMILLFSALTTLIIFRFTRWREDEI